ncbi:hemicentin-1-like isoform X1 [Choristoneura fumiferana]|uniref:hemicentin-1-like isoform X1 n=1 Tax=Choristoneura fumiferana TaxID=7141 RepID=UPI003D15873C
MDAKYIFWLTFLVAQASCEQKKSLTFVIDSTISMKDDITHVRKAAKSIMDIVLKEKSSQIEDIVLVIFRDPGWEFRKRTRDEAELKKALDDINLIGNWDCPEMCLSGIKMGLEQSQPGSFLYVFTDASAKDYKKFDEIKNLCQEKQIQVVFVLTGDCGDFGSPKSQVYYKIAAASNGQVFRISKGEVGQIFDYVKETIKGDMTVITSEVVPPHKWYTVHFNIDDKTEYALVSASGFNVQLKIRNQFKKKVRGIEVTWTKNVKALKLVGLRPGAYKAFVHGSSDVNVMIFGRTDFNFNFGFSNKTENSLKYTEAQPTQGTTTHLIISVKDDEHSVNIQNVEILDMNERVIQRLPLTNVGGSVYATTKFLPPNAMFKVAVTATARSTGKAIRRIANTPVEPIKPVVVKPEISDTEKILKAKEGEKVNIHCRIRRGKPKPHITWYFRQRGASQFKLLPGKADDVLLMNNVLVRDTGDYQCVAENIAGRATHIVQLEVFGLPAFEKSPSVLEVRQSANLDIQCKIRSGNPPPAITWQFKTSETGEYHNIDNFGELLRIFNVQQSNSGFYKCEAKNNIGTTQQIAQVIVLVNPEFEDTPAKITEKENAPVTLMCKLRKGNPRPKITWYFQASGSKIFTTLSNNGEELRLPAVQVKDSGEYRCVAENSAGRGVRTMMVTVLVRPEISDTEKILKAKEGEKVNIHCRIRRGKPKPHITWYFRQRGASQFKLLPGKTDDVLLMNNVLVRDTGDYQCVAENIAGRATHKVQLEVFGLPAFEKSPSVLKVRQSANLDIQCKIRSGNPPPAITWQFKTSETGEYHNIDNFGELLRIFNVQQSNSGFYKCEAKNNIGTTQQIAQVIVLVNPEFEDTPAKITEKENAPVTLKCKLRKGNPRPKITWYFQASGSKHFTTLSNSGEELRLPAVQLKDSGEYRCVAENSAGRDERTMTVTVLVKPEISDTEKILKAKEGEKVNIHCRIRRGKPKPHITWYFRQRGASQFKLLPGKTDDVLLMNVLVRDTGDYQCVAENIAGRATHKVQLEVFGLPAFEKSPSVLEVRQSANLDIQCKIRSGNPPPAITWQFKTSETGEYHNIDNFGELLRIFNVQQSNSGFYKCEAKNNIGTTQQIAQVIVLVNPEFEDTPAKIMEKENAPVTLKCKLHKGNPRPKITWYFQASGSKNFTTLSNSGEELRLPAVQLKDSGEYRCVAENSAGRDERTMMVTVLTAPEIERSTPSIIRVKENTTISIPCRLSNGFPKPTITWWYMDANSTEYAAIPDSNADFLHLEHIQLTKAGHYKCVARNTVGHTDKDVQIIVEAPARIVFIPPNSPFYEGVEGDVVMRLPCTAVGFPKPSVSWIVDQDVVGKDKSRSLYVEDDVFYLKNPQRFNSSNYSKNITHTYVCHAVNDFGKDKQSYEVTVLQYADYESNNTDEKYAEAKKPYDLNCPLPYTDPNSVRWFYDLTIMNKTGPILHFDDPTRANSGNYTCRVSDLNGAASYTIELKFDYPPSVSRLVYEAEWNGNEEEITCNAEILYGKYEWFYRGVKVKEAYDDKLELSLIGWGQYVCRVTNPLGTLNITYNIHAKDCIIEKNLSKTKNLPLVLDMSLAWPTFHRQNQYQIIPKSEKFTFICQDDWPKSKSYSQSESNSFMKFPNTKSIIATCDHEDLFLVDGVTYKLSELDCKHEVSSSVVPIKECLGSDTTMMSVGFNVNGFLDVYKSCLDTKRNVVLFTEVITTGADQFGYTDKPERPCESIEECCYESVQLVNAADVSAGPAEKATFGKPLNTVSYCKPNDENTTSWHDIETKVREKASQSRLMIWSGTVNYTTVDKLLVPQYLWKVVKDLDNEEILTIVHSNEQAPQASLCESVCQKSWFEPYGPRTYCCRLEEFKKVFNLTINF